MAIMYIEENPLNYTELSDNVKVKLSIPKHIWTKNRGHKLVESHHFSFLLKT